MLLFRRREDKALIFISKLDKSLYSLMFPNIVSDDVIITKERLNHIKTRRGEEFIYSYFNSFIDVIQYPDYVFFDRCNTVLICKRIDDGKSLNLVLRFATDKDQPGYKNSIISAMIEGKKRFNQRLRNNEPLYKRE